MAEYVNKGDVITVTLAKEAAYHELIQVGTLVGVAQAAGATGDKVAGYGAFRPIRPWKLGLQPTSRTVRPPIPLTALSKREPWWKPPPPPVISN